MRGDEGARRIEEPHAARGEPLELGDPALDPVEALAYVEPPQRDVSGPEEAERVARGQDRGGVAEALRGRDEAKVRLGAAVGDHCECHARMVRGLRALVGVAVVNRR